METATLIEYLKTEGYFELREVEGRGFCGIEKMIFTWRLWYGLDEDGKEGGYDFPTLKDAKEALKNWDGVGDPPGNWIKHKGGKGEYGNPNLDSN